MTTSTTSPVTTPPTTQESRPGQGPNGLTMTSLYVALLLTGAIFGVFYAWVCTVMWGFDAADPRVAIGAMQAVNAEIRNAVFFPAFFLTPIGLLIPAGLLWRQGLRRSSLLFGAAAVVYLLGSAVVTMTINVPMNQDLAAVVVPESIDEARIIWDDYSQPWQMWNLVRTVFCGVALLLASIGLGSVARRS